MVATVKVEGLRELEQELEKLTKAAGRGVLRRAGIKALVPMAEIARQKAPKDTGELSESIAVSARAVGAGADIGKAQYGAVLRGGGTKQQAAAALRAARRDAKDAGAPSIELFMGPARADNKRGAIKAIVQEFGSIKQAPQPYMRPAWDADKMAVIERLKKDLWIEVRKSVARAERKAARLAAKG